MNQPLLLVTNDDGVEAPGIRALEDALSGLGEVWTVAPEREQSATSHSLTLHKPLRMRELGPRRFAVSGTPTDAVLLAVRVVLPRRPTLVVSGINAGPNLADDVSYSGTVSAALEAALLNLPAVAVSRLGPPAAPFEAAAEVARDLVDLAIGNPLPPRAYLNVNVPDLPLSEIRGARITRLGRRNYSEDVVRSVDPRGRPYYWIGGAEVVHEDVEGSDCNAVDAGFVSVSPLTARFDLPEEAPRLRDAGFERGPWT